MIAHWGYLKYVCRHKWFVFIAGCKLGIPLLAALHDNSKFRPSEWFPYVVSFYVPGGRERGKAAFDRAWLHHQNRNKHHWNYWLIRRDGGGLDALPMPDRYQREMVADWIGAGKAQGKHSPKDDPYRETRAWYTANQHKMQLHPETREWVEVQIGIRSACRCAAVPDAEGEPAGALPAPREP